MEPTGRRIRAVFFDLGSTLLDVSDIPGWVDLARRLGFDLDAEAFAHAHLEVVRETDHPPPLATVEEFWRLVLSRAAEREVSLAVATRFAELQLASPPYAALYSDTQRCLDALAGDHRKLGVISNSRSEEHIRSLMERTGILRYFSVVVSSGTEGVVKPDPEIFHRAVARIGVAAAEAFHVGDLAYLDAVAAREAGLASVWLHRNGTGFGSDPPEITSLLELPGWIRRLEAGQDPSRLAHPAPLK